MRAVVENGGFQYRIGEQSTILVPRIQAEVGEVLRLPKVLMLCDGEEVSVGSPYVEGVVVEGRVVSHGKHPKTTVYKYKSKKNYRRKRGHRQGFTELLITRIGKPGEPLEASRAEAEVVEEGPVQEDLGAKSLKAESTKSAPKRRRIFRGRQKSEDE